MNQLQKIGVCPYCDCTLILYKSKDNSRYIKCEICGHVYDIPTGGEVITSSFKCPLYDYPVLIIRPKDSKQYFFTDRLCSECREYENCRIIQRLRKKFDSKSNLDEF